MLLDTTTVFDTPPDGLCLSHALARVWNKLHPQGTQQTGERMKDRLFAVMEENPHRTTEGQTLAEVILEDGWEESHEGKRKDEGGNG